LEKEKAKGEVHGRKVITEKKAGAKGDTLKAPKTKEERS